MYLQPVFLHKNSRVSHSCTRISVELHQARCVVIIGLQRVSQIRRLCLYIVCNSITHPPDLNLKFTFPDPRFDARTLAVLHMVRNTIGTPCALDLCAAPIPPMLDN